MELNVVLQANSASLLAVANHQQPISVETVTAMRSSLMCLAAATPMLDDKVLRTLHEVKVRVSMQQAIGRYACP